LVRELVVRFTDNPGLGVLGDAGVRVLELNLALDNL
jgi:K+-transporting ATPase c subunit